MTQKFEHIQTRKMMVVSTYGKSRDSISRQKAICKLYEIQCSIRNKYVTKKKEKLLGFSFLQKTKKHYQIFEKIKKRSLVKL